MEDVLWYVFASTRGGPTRAEIVRELLDRPKNANQLAESLEYDYTTIRHHLDVLQDNNILKATGSGYGDVYSLTDAVEAENDTFEEIIEQVMGS